MRPTSLRGLAPDQTLVLVNGKRRHRAALIAESVPAAGKGAHGPNIGMLPSNAIETIEVLRDGAAAQYGADAIAGVINLRMKDARQGGEASVQFGRFVEGEQSVNVSVNAGVPLAEAGFANVSMEYVNNEAHSRGVQRPAAQALIDAGVPNVGADSPFDDAPLVHTWGRPQSEDARLFVNAGVPLGGGAEAYAHGNLTATKGRYRFNYRPGDNPATELNEAHITIRTLGIERTLPQGFTPFFDGDHTDASLVAGIAGDVGRLGYDFSAGYGSDELDFYLNNTINPDLGLGADGLPEKMDFDVGALRQEELNVNADFTRALDEEWHVAFGAEWREETFTVIPGEHDSWKGAGASGFKGFEPNNAGAFSRDNVALYAELEHDLNARALVQYAMRYEDFSDFGGTLNGKLAGRLNLTDRVTLRGSVATGFHAPTPGQSNLRKVTTTFTNDTGLQVESGTVSPSHPLAVAAGGAPLKEEESLGLNLGIALGRETLTFTADAYFVQVGDRIFKTRSLTSRDPVTGIGSNVQFFTNALDIHAHGLDAVFKGRVGWLGYVTDLSIAFNHNVVEVAGQRSVGGTLPVNAADVEDIENSYPKNRLIGVALTPLGPRWDFMARLNVYGPHYAERGRIGGVDGAPPTRRVGATAFVDLELGLNLTGGQRVVFGAANVFDDYVERIGPPWAHRLNVGLPYARRTAANYEGGSWYMRLNRRW